MHARSNDVPSLPVETRALREALDFLEAREHGGGVHLLLGPSGSGRSTILEAHARRAGGGRPGGVLLHRTAVPDTPLSLVRSLLGSLGVGWHGPTRSGLEVLERLAVGAGVRLLGVDDAVLLSRPTLEMLRGLCGRMGWTLVLAGDAALLRHLRSRCASLLASVGDVHPVAPLELPDVRALMGLPAGARDAWRWEAPARALLRAGGGNVGRVLRLLEAAERRAWEQGVPMSPGLLARVVSVQAWVAWAW